MPSKKKIPPVPANENKIINEGLTNEQFRNWLLDAKTNRKLISDHLDAIGIVFGSPKAKDQALDAIEKIDWKDLKTLEDLLGRDAYSPRMN